MNYYVDGLEVILKYFEVLLDDEIKQEINENFDDALDEQYESEIATICGKKFLPSDILKKLDPKRYEDEKEREFRYNRLRYHDDLLTDGKLILGKHEFEVKEGNHEDWR